MIRPFWPACVVALFVATPSSLWAQPIAAPTSGTRLELQTRGEVRVVPDLVVINAGVVTDAVDASTAMRDNAARMTRVMTALKAAGIAERDIQTQSINLSPQYRYAQNEAPVLIGYQASNSLTVQFRDIAKSGSVLDLLVKQGVNQINGPAFVLEHRGPAEDKARMAALKTLQDRAALYARTTGMTVRRIISLSETAEFAGPPMPVLMARAASADMALPKTEIAAGEQAVTVLVSAVFDIQ